MKASSSHSTAPLPSAAPVPRFFLFVFFPSHLLSLPFCSLSLLVATQIRGHIAGSSPPLPTTVRALHFYREKISAISSLVDSRRIVLTHDIFLVFFENKFKISPRRESNSLTNTTSIRGLPLVHRGDRHAPNKIPQKYKTSTQEILNKYDSDSYFQVGRRYFSRGEIKKIQNFDPRNSQ